MPTARGRGASYRTSARFYDRIYGYKNYAAEAREVRSLVRRYGLRPSRSLLDVGCGTGAHLKHFVRWYRSTGVDAGPAMLRVARRKLPATRFAQGRMQSFRLSEQFDILTCLFSAIGYVRSRRELVRTFTNFARHLRPGGVAIVEPWLAPQDFRSGHVGLLTVGPAACPIVRLDVPERRGDRSRMDMHHLTVFDGRIRYWVERHDMLLMDDRLLRRAFREAGLEVVHRSRGFATGRGLYVARRPLRGRPRDGFRTVRGTRAAAHSRTVRRAAAARKPTF